MLLGVDLFVKAIISSTGCSEDAECGVRSLKKIKKIKKIEIKKIKIKLKE